jgi:hypothetical protein
MQRDGIGWARATRDGHVVGQCFGFANGENGNAIACEGFAKHVGPGIHQIAMLATALGDRRIGVGPLSGRDHGTNKLGASPLSPHPQPLASTGHAGRHPLLMATGPKQEGAATTGAAARVWPPGKASGSGWDS